MFRRSPQLRPVRALRHQRRLRMQPAGSRSRVAEGRAQRVLVLRAAHDGRARDQIGGVANQPVERQEGLRRFVQVNAMRRLFVPAAAIASVVLGVPAAAQQTHRLEATPSTIAYGHYDAATPPVLRIKSGDIIDVDTLLTNTPAGLQRAGVAADQIQASLKAIVEQTPADRKG